MALAVLLMSATPSLADLPQANSDSIRKNPYCSTDSSDPKDPVQLASGSPNSTIRLRPIGKAIGLKTLQYVEPDTLLPQDVNRSRMLIEPVPSVVRTNPLFNADEPTDQTLIDTDVTNAISEQVAVKPVSGKTTVFKSLLKQVPVDQPIATNDQTAEPVATARAHRQPSPQQSQSQPSHIEHRTSSVIGRTASGGSTRDVQIALPEVSDDAQQPIQFSLSDREPNRTSAWASIPDAELIDIRAEETPVSNVKEQGVSAAEPSQAGGIDELSSDDSATQPKITAPPSSQRSVPGQPVRVKSKPRLVKRYRPPVSVKVVSLEIERTLDGAGVDATVHAVAGIDLSSTTAPSEPKANSNEWPVSENSNESVTANSNESVTANSTESVTANSTESVTANSTESVTANSTELQLNLAQVRSLTLGGDLRDVKVSDTAICKVVATGPREVKLIGTGTGVTELLVLADGNQPGAQPRQRLFAVRVSDAAEASGPSLHKTCELLNQSIREAFPGCEVGVRQHGNGLMVAGRCNSQSSAKKVLRMVRKICLVPVKDELIVQ